MTNYFQQEYNKLKWIKWEYTANKFDALKYAQSPIPPEHGVYLFRAPCLINRVIGASDIIYIGQSGGGKRGGRQGIGRGLDNPGRLFNVRGLDKWIREKIEQLYPNGKFYVDCAFFE